MSRKLTIRRAVGLAVAVVATTPVLAFGAAEASARRWPPPRPTPPTRPPVTAPTTVPRPPQTCTTIPFDSARVLRRPPLWDRSAFSPFPQYVLVVRGTAPSASMTVKLVPHTYIQQPEHWGIEVQGCVDGDLTDPAVQPYTVALSVMGSMGTQGIEVIGSNRRQRINLPPLLIPRTTTTTTTVPRTRTTLVPPITTNPPRTIPGPPGPTVPPETVPPSHEH